MNFLQRIWGRIHYFFNWHVFNFPENVRTYGLSYSLERIFIGWWWYGLKYGISNLISYFTLIWCDRDWDYHFWLKMNYKKLDRMEHLIRVHGSHLYHERDADNIRKAKLALKRVLDDNYHENAMINHNKREAIVI